MIPSSHLLADFRKPFDFPIQPIKVVSPEKTPDHARLVEATQDHTIHDSFPFHVQTMLDNCLKYKELATNSFKSTAGYFDKLRNGSYPLG